MLLLHLLPTPYCSPKPCFPILGWDFSSRSASSSHFAYARRTFCFQNSCWLFRAHTGKSRPPRAAARPEGHPSRARPIAALQQALPPPAPRRLPPPPLQEGDPGNPPAGSDRTSRWPQPPPRCQRPALPARQPQRGPGSRPRAREAAQARPTPPPPPPDDRPEPISPLSASRPRADPRAERHGSAGRPRRRMRSGFPAEASRRVTSGSVRRGAGQGREARLAGRRRRRPLPPGRADPSLLSPHPTAFWSGCSEAMRVPCLRLVVTRPGAGAQGSGGKPLRCEAGHRVPHRRRWQAFGPPQAHFTGAFPVLDLC